MRAQQSLALLALTLAVTGFAGCSGSTDSTTDDSAASDNSTPAAGDSNGGSAGPEEVAGNGGGQMPAASVGGTDGAGTDGAGTADSEAALPEGIPEDIHIADGATSSQLNEAGGKQSLILEYPAGDAAPFIKDYHEAMKSNGWTLVTSSELPIGTIANFTKDDRKCTISISPPKEEIIKVAIMLP